MIMLKGTFKATAGLWDINRVYRELECNPADYACVGYEVASWTIGHCGCLPSLSFAMADTVFKTISRYRHSPFIVKKQLGQ